MEAVISLGVIWLHFLFCEGEWKGFWAVQEDLKLTVDIQSMIKRQVGTEVIPQTGLLTVKFN